MISCYYAHPMSLYGTPQQARDLNTLYRLGFTVVNPDDEQYKGYKMDQFCDLVRNCSALAFRAMPDGSITSGVALEIKAARQIDNPVIELPGGILRRTLSVQETIAVLEELGER